MIIGNETEVLQHKIGTKNINMKDLLFKSKDMCSNWKDFSVNNSEKVNFELDNSLKLVYNPVNNEIRTVDITENAFLQLCQRVGVPSSYIKKCFASDKRELAIDNFKAWSNEMEDNLLIREYNGVARAVLSEKYVSYDTDKIIKLLYNTVDDKIYQPNQFYMSEDRFHIRFVNFEPLPFDDDKLYSGFTVTSSDVGRGSLNIKYFIYRFACMNGIVMSQMGGTLYKQSHIGANMENGKLSVFNKALMDMEKLNLQATNLIKECRKKTLKDYELQIYLEKVKRELKLSQKSEEKLHAFMNEKYGSTKWGIINSITELSQDYTLDTRLEFEHFAGNLLVA